MIRAEAVACVRKYFVEASMDRGCDLLAINGRTTNVLSSSATHISTRWVEDRKMSVVIVSVVKMTGWKMGMS